VIRLSDIRCPAPVYFLSLCRFFFFL